ncbi:pantoate--beta-alanine ligase [Maribacter polysiphoniae]|uniref:Pantothenate synthetase n=1 Tax=Maribacter polysiphoniae TaxID=429344 RepID=A0A316E513_9FLAO|nr:pantoate--beta-alanine ligase [Maribacter polysiphoniae]MBD1260305.1 pantoate--beta-alanine ligase [Maribacter polysiphoniae]PWK25767.1 pantoate--beta-alanine ligase [Maribacter polysiphoniae]
MLLINTRKELKDHLSSLKKNDSLGLVPTMGALHIGHAALVERAVQENSVVVVSIFVNPTQFNNPEDLENYPQTLTADLDILEKIANHIIVFAPNIQEMYAENVTSTTYDFDGLDKVMEGAFREGHFDGVGTIVEALLTLVKPTRAYFGEKDYQQLQIIKKLTEIRHIPVEIVGCPIVREENGLAFSSRNERLTENMRKEASFIYRTLTTAKKKFGTESAVYVTEWVTKQFEEHPELELEYIAIAQADTLKPVVKKQKNKKYRAFIAVYTEGVRLIDNIALN